MLLIFLVSIVSLYISCYSLLFHGIFSSNDCRKFIFSPFWNCVFLQEDKVVQMYETMMTRHSTMLVGPTGGGKTVVINTLIKAQIHMGLPTKCTTLNPKVSSVSFCNSPSCMYTCACVCVPRFVCMTFIMKCIS